MKSRAGLTLASLAVVGSALGLVFAWKVLQRENRAYIQQSVGDTTRLLGNHVQNEVEHFIRPVRELAGEKLEKNLPGPVVEDVDQATVDLDPAILDFSLWRRPAPNAPKQDEFVRAYFALNTKFAEKPSVPIEQLRSAAAAETAMLKAAFAGKTIITGAVKHPVSELISLALPIRQGSDRISVQTVAVAHFRRGKLQRAFRNEQMVQTALVDWQGNPIVATEMDKFRRGAKSYESLIQALSEERSSVGQLELVSESDETIYGGYFKVREGGLALISKVSESEMSSGLQIVRMQTIFFSTLAFLFCALVAYSIFSKKPLLRKMQGSAFAQLSSWLFPESSAPRREDFEEEPTLIPTGAHEADAFSGASENLPRKARLTALHCTLRGFNTLLDTNDAQEASDALNDFFMIADHCVKSNGGVLERSAGAAFFAIWPGDGSENTAAQECASALQCALQLRREFTSLNEARRLSGHKVISFGMGIAQGAGLAARAGFPGRIRRTMIGAALSEARSLDRLSQSAQVDLLVNKTVWSFVHERFSCDRLGEAKLGHHEALQEYFSVKGFRDGEGQTVLVESPYANAGAQDKSTNPAIVVPDQNKVRWLINNGHQILGPFYPEQIATLLYSQEIDFDCECWQEGTGKSSQIHTSGIFGAGAEPDATLWVFDGRTLHGPLTHSFIRAAIERKAISESSAICDGSTVNGWKSPTSWLETSPQPSAQKRSAA